MNIEEAANRGNKSLQIIPNEPCDIFQPQNLAFAKINQLKVELEFIVWPTKKIFFCLVLRHF